MGIRAFAFDLDETLVDVEAQHRLATRILFEAAGVDESHAAKDVFHDVTGKRTRDLVEAFRVATGARHSLGELLALRHTAFLQALDDHPPAPLPGAREVLEAAAVLGPVVLVTSGYRDDALATLEAAGLSRHFQGIVTGEDVEYPKPHPEPYLVAASRMGARPHEVLAFEDSHRGVLAARTAGCRIVAVPNPRNTPRMVVEPDAHAVLASLVEALPLEAFLRRLP